MNIDYIDAQTHALYLQIDPARIVALQTLFESYEGAGTVRSLNPASGIMAILTTPSMSELCVDILHSIRDTLPWQELARPVEAVHQLIEGNFQKAS